MMHGSAEQLLMIRMYPCHNTHQNELMDGMCIPLEQPPVSSGARAAPGSGTAPPWRTCGWSDGSTCTQDQRLEHMPARMLTSQCASTHAAHKPAARCSERARRQSRQVKRSKTNDSILAWQRRQQASERQQQITARLLFRCTIEPKASRCAARSQYGRSHVGQCG